MKEKEAVKKAKALESIAEFIVENAEYIPDFTVHFTSWLSEWRFDDDKELAEQAVGNLARSALDFGWKVQKDYKDTHMHLNLSLPAGKVQFWVERETVCTKTVVGTETVTRKVATAWEEEEVEQDIVEWDCKPLLKAVK
tara:strand:- start:5320 stop:5736 length:417 start_codon:yes stop_codon:yes gene_type:complete